MRAISGARKFFRDPHEKSASKVIETHLHAPDDSRITSRDS